MDTAPKQVDCSIVSFSSRLRNQSIFKEISVVLNTLGGLKEWCFTDAPYVILECRMWWRIQHKAPKGDLHNTEHPVLMLWLICVYGELFWQYRYAANHLLKNYASASKDVSFGNLPLIPLYSFPFLDSPWTLFSCPQMKALWWEKLQARKRKAEMKKK